MKKYILVTESGTDLPKDLEKLHNIYVLPMHVVMDDVDYKDGAIQVTEIYDYHKRTKKIPTTSAVNPNEYEELFQKITKENPGCIIIHIGYSSKASCTYQNANIGSAGMKNVLHVDSLNVSGGEAAIVLKAANLIENFSDIEPMDLVEKIEQYVKRARVSFIPGELEYLKAGGRLSNASYLGATILQIKPVVEILDGKLVVTQKYRGSIKRVAEKYVNEYIEKCNMDREQVYFIYSLGLDEEVKQCVEEIAKEKGFKNINWIQTGCVISTHGGPGAIGVVGFIRE